MTPPNVSIGVIGDDSPTRSEQALAVLQGGLGHGFISQEQLSTYTTPRTAEPFHGALAASDSATGNVMGVLLFEIVDAAALQASFLGSFDATRINPALRLLSPDHTGLIKSIAVSPGYQGRGIASALVTSALAELVAHGAEQTYSLAWASKERGCQLCGVLTSVGFRAVQRIERFWYNDSIANGYICPVCGNPCECAVWVMIR